MKHKLKLTVIGGILFSYLFYQQNFGLNAMAFSIILLILMSFQHPDFSKSKYSFICGFGNLFSAFFIYWNNSTISVIAFFVSLTGMMTFKNEGNFTLLNYIATYVINFVGIPLVILRNYTQSSGHKDSTEKNEENSYYDKMKKAVGYVVVLIIIIIFFFVYQSANPLFYQYTKDINLFDLNFGFIFFCLLGSLLLSVLFYNTAIKVFFKMEDRQRSSINEQHFLGGYIEKYSIQTIFFLFIVLNLMLCFINLLDINYLYLSHTMPKGITQAEFVHNGVGTLIFSIILGASIICYIFKGELNFIKENKSIKVLVYLWIAQNIFMVISTMLRNNMYVYTYGLTGKRIGVYYYLFFTIIGLIFTAYKIRKQKTVYFLYSTNTWIWYVVLVISCSVNWDNMIFKNQIEKYAKKDGLDFEYTTHFKNSNLPELITLFNVGKKDSIDFKNPNNLYVQCNDYLLYKNDIEAFLVSFLDKHNKTDWQSEDRNSNNIYDNIIKLDKQQQFYSITLNTFADESEQPVESIACLKNLKCLEISEGEIDWKNLHLLRNVEKVIWHGDNLIKLKYFKTIPNLKELVLTNLTEPSKDYFEEELPNINVITN